MNQGIKIMMNEADLDGDGQVSFKEFAAMIQFR